MNYANLKVVTPIATIKRTYGGKPMLSHTTRAMLLATCLFALAPVLCAQETKQVEYWKGTLNYKGTELEMGLKVFQKANGALTATFDSYTQGATDIPTRFKKEGDFYELKIPAAGLTFTGNLDESKQKLSGMIKQRGSEIELVFTRADAKAAPKYKRPQTPTGKVPYDSIDVSYKNSTDDITLAGTLTIPRGNGPFPVAITISGSGGADRDESHFGHKPFHVIADHLARNGIAMLRFDDRGVGKSTGDRSGATSADFARDVEAGIDFLKKQPKIDADRIGLIGHSEGGLIAPMVAQQRDDVHFIVMLAGTGVNGGEILKTQSTAMMKAGGLPDAKLEANRKAHDAILAAYRNNPKMTLEELESAGQLHLDSIDDPSAKELAESSVENLVGILKTPWVKFFVLHEPAETLAKVDCHVLALNGEKDLQVLCDLNLDPIAKALESGPAESYDVISFPNVNHMFQETDGSGSPEDYGKIEQTLSPKVLKKISSWITSVVQ